MTGGGSRGGGSNSGPKSGPKSGGSGTRGSKGTSSPASGRTGGARALKVRVKTAKRRSVSSSRWLARQLNDPYVAEAKRQGYRSRSAFKLAEIDDKAHLIRKGARIVDLGAAPGGWCQVALARAGEAGRVVAIDLQEIEPLVGVDFLHADFLADDVPDKLRARLDGPVDLVLSDMAAASTGHGGTDHLRIMALAEAALDFAVQVLAPGGGFVAKVLQGGSEQTLLKTLKQHFDKVRHIKPPSSRKDSAELYVVATGFRGAPENDTGTDLSGVEAL